MSGKQVKLFLVDGAPGGLTTAEITNWTGMYLLLGDDESSLGGTKCYIGEADIVATRLKSHVSGKAEKDFWDRVVVITSKDANLTKSHGRYRESRLISLAKQAGRVSLENGTEPPIRALPEADQSSPVFRLAMAKLGVEAHAQQIDGEFTMLAGSTVAGASRSSTKYSASTARAYAGLKERLDKLVAAGSIVVTGGIGTVARDIVFNSPSTAGSIAVGHSCNGRTSWISPDGLTFGQWESRGVE